MIALGMEGHIGIRPHARIPHHLPWTHHRIGDGVLSRVRIPRCGARGDDVIFSAALENHRRLPGIRMTEVEKSVVPYTGWLEVIVCQASEMQVGIGVG